MGTTYQQQSFERPEYEYPWPDQAHRTRCSRCLYDETVPGLNLNEKGICSYCLIHDQMESEYPIGAEGEKRLKAIVDQIKAEGKGKKYDCIIGVSGGCDSSYLIHRAVELGLRPLAAHFDNTWNSTIANENIQRVIKKHNIDLYTIVVDNREYDDIYRSFLEAGVCDIEAPTDIGLAVTLYRAAEEFGVKTILEGHSFRTEGISPLGWLYMDGKYIKSVHKQFGKRPMKTYPNMPLHLFLKWMLFSRIRKVRPLYFMDYQKEEAKKMLTREYGWQWYGGHHLENRFTAFFHSYFFPRRWGYDGRLLGYSALIRSGQMTREEGLKLIEKRPDFDPEILDYLKKRLQYSDAEFERLMTLPKRTFREFPTYKTTFEKLSPLFWVLYKLDLVTKSFYIKYTKPMQ